MKLEEKIMTLRKRNGWSQEELAFRLDVSRQAVSKWEMGASVPDLDKIIKMSEIFGCTTDYLLKDETAESISTVTEAKNAEAGRQVCDEEGEAYLSLVRKHSWTIAIGVLICVLSPIGLFLFEALWLTGHFPSEDLAGVLGIVFLLALCAVGVVFFIVGGISLSKYDYLEKEVIEISDRLQERLREKRAAENKGFITAIAVGVTLCILSVVPLLISAAFEEGDVWHCLTLALLFPIAACGVFLFVKFGMIRGSYAKLLQEEEYSVEKKRKEKKTSIFASAYWCFVTSAYLIVSFLTTAWHRTWIIWPVAGVFFAGLQQIVYAIMQDKKGKK